MAQKPPQQLRYLRRRLLRTMIGRLVIFAVVFFVIVFCFDRFAAPSLGQWIADSTSQWSLYEPGDADGDANALSNETAHTSSENAVARIAGKLSADYPGTIWDIEVNPIDGGIWVRDITVYQTLSNFWPVVALALFAVGCLIIVSLTLRKSLSYFDELEHAVENLLQDREKSVELTDELALTENALNALRERTLQSERETAAAEARKNELVAYLAHDIRTPLTSIIGYQHLMLESETLDASTRRRYGELTLKKSEELNDLVEELFDITRLNVSELDLGVEPIDLHLLCLQVSEELYPLAHERSIIIEVSCDDLGDKQDPITIVADGPKLARALRNVVRNAIVYADPSTVVTITLAVHDAQATISVADQGATIAPEHIPHIFEKFYREDAARSTDRGGAGLGLAIAREIIEAHRGTIAAESTDGTTTFTITLPTGHLWSQTA